MSTIKKLRQVYLNSNGSKYIIRFKIKDLNKIYIDEISQFNNS